MSSAEVAFIRKQFSLIIWTISLLGAIICLIPLLTLYSGGNPVYSTDDITFLRSPLYDISNSLSLTASLYVVIIPLVDLAIDFFRAILDYCFNVNVDNKKIADTVVTRLTDFERFIFIVGVVVQCSVCFLAPRSTDLATLGIIYDCTNNASVLLCLSPIYVYAERATTTFTKKIIFILVSLSVAGLGTKSLSFKYRNQSDLYQRMEYSSGIILCSGFAFASLAIIKCFILSCIEMKFLRFNWKAKCNLSEKCHDVKKGKTVSRLYSHYIPALHILAAIIIAGSNFYPLSATKTSTALDIRNIVILCGEVMVLVIELRIRKNEIATALVTLYACK